MRRDSRGSRSIQPYDRGGSIFCVSAESKSSLRGDVVTPVTMKRKERGGASEVRPENAGVVYEEGEPLRGGRAGARGVCRVPGRLAAAHA